MKILRLVTGLILLTVFVGCPQLDLGRLFGDEVARVASPDGRLEAILEETNGGATTSFGYVAYLVEKGHSPSESARVASFYGAVRSESAYGVNLVWLTSDELELQYLKAKQSQLIASSPVVGGSRISVRLRPGIGDPSAPSGGMLYNLDRLPTGAK
jgi:hypothetical protein